MKRYLFMWGINIAFLLVGFACKRDLNMNYKTKFQWTPSISAPRNYPVETKYVSLGYGSDGEEYPIMNSYSDAGIAVTKGKVSFEQLEDTEGLDIPNSINALWLSYTESKIYEVHTKFSDTLQQKILQLLRDGYYDAYDKKHTTYKDFSITMLPGGKIWLYLEGATRNVLICDTIHAHPVEMSLEDFAKDAPLVANSVKDYSEGCLTKEQSENLKVNGIPYELWDKYNERYNYDIQCIFENKNSKLDSLSIVWHFINGEFNYACDGIKEEEQARLKQFYMDWEVGDKTYSGEFYFEEQEILDAFPKVFNGIERRKKGNLTVYTSKYNNKFDISLNVGEKRILLSRTRILVFCQKTDQPPSSAKIIYDNHRDINPEDIKFIGE